MDLAEYLADVQRELQAGQATEHSFRPALKALLESWQPGVLAVNEPRRVACGAPDYIVTRNHIPLGHVEAKELGKPLDPVEREDQLRRYRESLHNLILTDYLEFRWFVGGQHQQTARLGTPEANGRIRRQPGGAEALAALLNGFFSTQVATVTTPRDLAERMAALARLIRDTLQRALGAADGGGDLRAQMDAFSKVLLHDLTEEQFADMYAQTLCYGLFTARCSHTSGERFTRQNAAYELPKTNPFLRKTFSHIAGPDLDERVVWVVDDLAELLNRADMDAILEHFGRRTRQQDPVVHFYETFLAAYAPEVRERRGVYYTPEPVVSYIVRSVDWLLKERLGIAKGLADDTLLQTGDGRRETGDRRPDQGPPSPIAEVPRVQILDPATGTGTFLFGVIDQIYAAFQGNQGMWSGYVAKYLLPRLYGFELLMAPYAVAHMKLGLQLAQTGYDFQADERVGIYLTNTLEEAAETARSLFSQWLAEEANAAGRVKQHAPVMVVLGNPPYSGHSANRGDWIHKLLRGTEVLPGGAHQPTASYFEVDGHPLRERNPKWLNDDYVKFVRFAQWRIEKTGHGILAFITNHSYLDNPTFRGMRQSLLRAFDEIYVLDLHGNARKRERAPDGTADENVFDIQQGVAIGLFVKRPGTGEAATAVQHAHAWGAREAKYRWLSECDVAATDWAALEPHAPFYLFVPQDPAVQAEFQQGWSIPETLPTNSVGLVTARDSLTIHWTAQDAWETVRDFAGLPEAEAREKYRLGRDTRDWKVTLAQKDLSDSGPDNSRLAQVLYRPFDFRWTYYTGRSRGFQCMPRGEVMGHMLAGGNLGLIATRQTRDPWAVLATRSIVGHKALAAYDINTLFPLYTYNGTKGQSALIDGRLPNLAPGFVRDFGERLEMRFVPDGKGDRQATFGPEDVFAYLYAVMHAPTYHERYAEFLRIDFPRVPLTRNPDLFRALCALGDELVAYHLLERRPPSVPGFPVAGSDRVEGVRYTEPGQGSAGGRVWINNVQYFAPVEPEVWGFHVGGYQVCEKWLKDRKGRTLSYDDLSHYARVVGVLSETLRLVEEIDAAIAGYGGWPVG